MLENEELKTEEIQNLLNDKKMIDVSELLRVFSTIQLEDQQIQPNTSNNTDNKQDNTGQEKIIKMLEEQLSDAKEREEWLRSQIAELNRQNNNLLGHTHIRRKKILWIF